MDSFVTQVGKSGRMVIPADYRKALGLKPGDKVILTMEADGGVKIMTTHQAVLRAQAEVRRYVSADRSLSEELMRERREAAERE